MKTTFPLLCAVSALAFHASAGYADSSQQDNLNVNSFPAKLSGKAVQLGQLPFADKARTAVKNAVRARGKECLAEKAHMVGTFAQNKFRELLLKDSSVRIVNSNGEEVGLHIEKANSEVLRNLVRKLSGLNLDQSIPCVPAPVAKFVLNKVENILLAQASEYFGGAIERLTYNLAIQSLGQAWNIGHDQLQSYLKASPAPVKSDVFEVDTRGLEGDQATALQGIVNHYSSKLKLEVNGMVEEAVRATVTAMASQAYETVEEKAEVAIRAAVFSPVVCKMPVLAPVAWLFGVLTPQKGSKFNQFSRWALGAEQSEAKLRSVAATNASSFLNRLAPSWLSVQERDLANVYGQFGIRVADDGFTEMYQTEAPKSVSHYLSAFETKAKETAREVAKAASDFSDLMGPEGLSQEEFAEKYGNEDPTNPIPSIVNAGKTAATKIKSWFGW